VALRWRLLLDGPGDGAWNMAVDAALLRSAQQGALPTLRFYSWDGAWLSLGLSQTLDPARRDGCRQAGVGVVRRATGGRAVLHGADLTYAVVAPSARLPRGLRATYALLGEALWQGLASLGIAADRSGSEASGPRSGEFDCFQSLATDELCVAGRKLAGSAQRRTQQGVLQHGSLRLAPDPPQARTAAGLELGAATSLAELGFAFPPERVRDALIAGFAGVLGVALEPGSLAAEERAWARERAASDGQALETPLPSGFSRGPAAGR
jgi:lipoate-protein ligase A